MVFKQKAKIVIESQILQEKRILMSIYLFVVKMVQSLLRNFEKPVILEFC
ncbi:unnamed protein product [Paramecium sonneborni]|uniref:Uncharacterized protein n=1 Tax=Paramecium sonneborni TaxID=65129 RepID=A0A8S1P068_9CILI|nr:unnamed protein product [Paramecium sonneborni]